MILLGNKRQMVDMAHLSTIQISGCPVAMPKVPKGYEVVCGLDDGAGERLFVCESLGDVQTLYSEYAEGRAVSIAWYRKSITACAIE
jgi:hypothetical protein